MLHLLDTKTLLLIALAWAAAAYLIVPALWVRHFRGHPFFAQAARIAADTVLRRPDDDAPVSNLFLFGRKQPMPGGPGKRHHVRFWRWNQLYEGRHGWFGAATFDSKVGLSHTTGQITHHIAPDVDAERDRLVSELRQAGVVLSVQWLDGFHTECEGRNGGGDPWHTDGRLAIVTLRGS